MQSRGGHQLTGWRWAAAVAGVVLLALLPLVVRSEGALAMEMHEIFVARATEEMLAADAWLVPRYNTHLRVSKPPLNYWAVMVVNALNGNDGLITPREARLPSNVAAVLWVLATLGIGALVAGRAAGLVAALVLIGTAGYVGYGSNARPDMLYVAFSTLGLLGFMLADRWQQDPARQRHVPAARWGGWGAMIVASMAKGPYVPLLIVATYIGYLVATGQRRRVGAVIGPVLGVPALAVGFAWWYVLVFWREPGAWEGLTDDLAVRVDGGNKSWLSWLEPYYLYTTAEMALPWLLLLGLAIVAPVFGWFRRHRSLMLLWWVCLVVALGFQVLWDRHRHYTLPLLGPLAVIFAVQAVHFGRWLLAGPRPWLWRGVVALHVVGFVALAVAVWWVVPPFADPPVVGLVTLVGVGAVALAVLADRRWGEAPLRSVGTVAVVAALMFAVLVVNASVWTVERVHQRAATREVAPLIRGTAPLVAWQHSFHMHYARYYMHRNIPTYLQADSLIEAAREQGELYVIACGPKALPEQLNAEQLIEVDSDGTRRPYSRVRLFRVHGVHEATDTTTASTERLGSR